MRRRESVVKVAIINVLLLYTSNRMRPSWCVRENALLKKMMRKAKFSRILQARIRDSVPYFTLVAYQVGPVITYRALMEVPRLMPDRPRVIHRHKPNEAMEIPLLQRYNV